MLLQVALILAACFTSVGVPCLGVFGPTFVVYLVRGMTSKARGSIYPPALREYIGLTERHVDERKQEHLGRAKNKGAEWLKIVEIMEDPIVLYETDSEQEALEVEMFAILWRFRKKDYRPFTDTEVKKGWGGKARGAWFLRSDLCGPEVRFIAMAFGEMHGVEPMPPLDCLKNDTWPARLCITKAVAAAARQWLWSEVVRRHHPADLVRHLGRLCFKCRSGGHLSRYCPVLFATPEAGRYVEPAVAAAVAPARPQRAAPGQGLQKNYHANPTFGGEKKCGDPGAEHPGPCYFGANGAAERCLNCDRKRQCKAGNGGAKKRKFDKEKCADYPNCGPALPSGRCMHCRRMVKRPRSSYARE